MFVHGQPGKRRVFMPQATNLAKSSIDTTHEMSVQVRIATTAEQVDQSDPALSYSATSGQESPDNPALIRMVDGSNQSFVPDRSFD